jgi:CubicO group peptidase (beta-lactamase class C family)
MASVSKPFVATAIVQLVEQGLIDLNEKVTTYLPYFRIDDERYREITIQQMLSHVSGMPDIMDYHWDKPEYDEGALERYVRSLTDQKLVAAPGDTFRYSNMAYEVLGDVIAKVSGQSFADYVKEHILDPLGMHHSTFLYEMPPELQAAPHVHRLRPQVSDVYPYHRAHGPSSTLHSNVSEMCNWAMATLNRGVLDGHRILPESSYDVLWEPHVQPDEDRWVGLSWFIGEYRGKRTITHSGGDIGFRSMMVLLPDDHMAVVTMCNSTVAPISSITYGALDAVLGEKPELPKLAVMFPMSKTLAAHGIEAAIAQYHDLKANQPDRYRFHEDGLNYFGYVLLELDMVEEAKKVLQLNIETYPESYNVYDSYAEACMINGDTLDAIANYEKSLELNPANMSAASILNKLRKEVR